MKMEDLVRQRHELEDKLEDFLTDCQDYLGYCLTMDLRSMETGMARLYDLMSQSPTEVDRLDKLFKGRLLKLAYDKKKAGARPTLLNRLAGACTIEELIEHSFNYPVPLTQQFIDCLGVSGSILSKIR